MDSKLAFVITTLAVVARSAAPGQVLLTQANLSQVGFNVRTVTNALNFNIGIGLDQKPPSAVFFEHLTFRTVDLGHTFSIGPGDDPDFAAFAAYLTDGHPSYLSDFTTIGPGGSGVRWIPEAQYFSSLPPGNNGIDLAGFQISLFTLRFDTLQFVSPGSNPNGDGVWTDVMASAVFSVYGQPIPEPTSLTTVFLVAATLIARGRMLARRCTD